MAAPVAKPAVKAADAPKPAVAAKPAKAPKAPAAPKAKAVAKAGSIAARTAPKADDKAAVVAAPAAKPAVKKEEKAGAKPTVTKKADKGPRGPKPGVSKADKGTSLTAKVLELFKQHGELEPIEVAKGTGVGAEKFNSVRSTINILIL